MGVTRSISRALMMLSSLGNGSLAEPNITAAEREQIAHRITFVPFTGLPREKMLVETDAVAIVRLNSRGRCSHRNYI